MAVAPIGTVQPSAATVPGNPSPRSGGATWTFALPWGLRPDRPGVCREVASPAATDRAPERRAGYDCGAEYPMIALLLTPGLVAAGTIEAWVADDFPNDGRAVAGSDGWRNGYDQDAWGGTRSDRDTWAYSTTDHTDDGGFGDGGALDNWLVNAAEPVMQGRYEVTSWVSDNDAFGVVFGFGADRYYLFLVCGEEGNDTSMQTCPVSGLTTQAIAIVEIRGGDATVLETVEHGCTGGEEVDIRVAMDDGQLVARYGDAELSTQVDAEFRLDGVGFYAYNDGFITEEGEDDGDSVYFRDPVLSLEDEDDDDVADDLDNCEEDANPGQEDLDADGIGSACDDAEDTDVPEDTGDTGTVTDTGGPDDGENKEIAVNGGGCACASGAGGAGLAMAGLAMAGLAVLRRTVPRPG